MKLIGVKDLKKPRQLRTQLEREGELLLTSNGKPTAILIHVDEGEDPEMTLRALRDGRSRMALSRIRRAARRSGVDSWDDSRIEDLVRRVRAQRKKS